MPREIMLRGERVHVDVVTGTVQTVPTQYGPLEAKPGDVLVPWGTGVHPIPQKLLEALSLCAEEHNDEVYVPAHNDGANGEADFRDMKWQELRAYAMKEYPGAYPWLTMKRDEVEEALRELSL